MKNWRILLLLGLSSFRIEPLLAHGAKIEYGNTNAIIIRATYDDGKPMQQAQAVVYAPNAPTVPWIKGITDQKGQFTFIPDPSISGNWDVKVRQSGHGNIVTIPIQEGVIASKNKPEVAGVKLLANNSNLTYLQKIMMAAVGIWGFIGTALFFSRKPVTEKNYQN